MLNLAPVLLEQLKNDDNQLELLPGDTKEEIWFELSISLIEALYIQKSTDDILQRLEQLKSEEDKWLPKSYDEQMEYKTLINVLTGLMLYWEERYAEALPLIQEAFSAPLPRNGTFRDGFIMDDAFVMIYNILYRFQPDDNSNRICNMLTASDIDRVREWLEFGVQYKYFKPF